MQRQDVEDQVCDLSVEILSKRTFDVQSIHGITAKSHHLRAIDRLCG